MAFGFALCYSLPTNTYNDGLLYFIIAVFAASILFTLISGFFGFPLVRRYVLRKQNRESENMDEIGIDLE
jgi:hypothetical protein